MFLIWFVSYDVYMMAGGLVCWFAVLFLWVALLCNIKKYIYIDINYNMRPGGFHVVAVKIKNIFSFF
jgi:hypothetical protein